MNDEDDEKKRLLELLGIDDVRLLERRARFAGWDMAIFRKELATPDTLRARFEASVDVGVAAEIERKVAKQMRELLRNGPRTLATATVAELAELTKDARVRAVALSYDPFTMGGRLVCGPTGLGKSVAGIAAVRRIHGISRADMNALWDVDARSHSVGWVRAFDMANARLSHGLGKGESPLVQEAIDADFLVMDDIGWESKRAGADDVVVEVIAARYDAGRITYATTGLNYEQIESRYGEAVIRRLCQSRGLPGRVLNLWAENKTS